MSDLGQVSVTVKVYGYLVPQLAPYTDGGSALSVAVPKGTTVDGLLQRLAAERPAFASTASTVGAMQIVIGERLLELAGGPERVLITGDTLLLFPPFSGG